MSRRPLPWLLRAAWVILPFTAGPGLADALDDTSRSVQLVASAGLWAGWAVGLVATLVALPVALTAVRVLAPAALAATLAATDALGAATTALAAVLAFTPQVAEEAVNGPAYGDERRYPLRAPGPLLLGPLEVTWALAVAGVAAGPLLLAAEQWVAGAAAVAVGVPVAALALRSLHALARRWLVFVPAGVVLHDPLSLADPVLFPRRTVRRLAPAAADTDALDLTQRALGLALEIRLQDPVELPHVRPGRRRTESATVDAFLASPTRPGAVVTDAQRRRFSVTAGG